MKNRLIKFLGGLTRVDATLQAFKIRDTEYRYYLNLRHRDLCRDREMAIKHHRTRVDIDRRLQALTMHLVEIEDKEVSAMSCGLQKHLRAGA